MLKSRPVQYLGLALLVLASLVVIFFPIGPRPEEQPYTLELVAPKSFDELARAAKKPPVDKDKPAALNDNTPVALADAALNAEFKTEKLPGALELGADGTPEGQATPVAAGARTATITDRATTAAEANVRTQRILKALSGPFPGIKLAPDAKRVELPAKPILAIGDTAIFSPKTENGSIVPAVKLGLDLQGGVNLVLQVRRALYAYRVDDKTVATLKTAEARDAFASSVRDALAKAPRDLLLNEADVSLSPSEPGVIEVRTQAADRNVFKAQQTAIENALKTGLPGVTITPARDAQFFDPTEQTGTDGQKVDQGEVLKRAVEILRSRVDSLGVSEPQIQEQLPDRIIVQLPGVNDPQKAVAVIGQTAQMQIRLLPQNIDASPDPNDQGNTIFRDKTSGNIIPPSVVKEQSQLIVDGQDVKPTSRVGYDQGQEPAVYFELQGEGATRFGQITAANIGRQMPIFLDERAISAPVIRSAITGGSGQISGGFKTLDEARNLALLLNSGALPAPIDVVENRTVSATLGADSLTKSLRAGLIGILAVVVFMILYYRLPGLLANCALVIYCILNLAVFVLIGGTLTLPGIAGFLLAIAMSLDTNILVFERLREEMGIQPTFAGALRAAFSRAWTAILDSHVTTLIASVVLFNLGTGPVKGFALTLGIGVVLSLFSAISVTRLFMWSVAGLGEKNRALFGKPVYHIEPNSTTSTTATTR